MRWSVKFRSARGQTRGDRRQRDGRTIDGWRFPKTGSKVTLAPSVRLIGRRRGRMGTNSGIGKRPLEIWGRRKEKAACQLDADRPASWPRLCLISRLCEKIRCNFDLEEFRQACWMLPETGCFFLLTPLGCKFGYVRRKITFMDFILLTL